MLQIGLCALAGAVAAAGQQPGAFVRNEVARSQESEEQRYRIGPGDLLDVRVFGHPEMGREVRVDNLGRIRLPFLDEMQAACLTEAMLARALEERYRKYLRAPQVDVLIKDYQSQPVAVIGAVLHPGRFLLQRRVRLLELLALAGGANQMAGGNLHLIRGKDYDFCATPKTDSSGNGSDDKLFDGTFMVFKLTDLLNGTSQANIFIEPGDIISVPEAEQIFMTGGVMRPGPIPLRQATTLLQAIGMVGGFFPDAAKKRIRLLRQVPGSPERKEETLDYEAIEKRKAPDVLLQANDLIEVPSSSAKSMGRGLLGLIVPTIGQLPLRVIRPY